MRKIKVDTTSLATQAQKMRSIAEQLNNIAERVVSANNTLRWNTSIEMKVRQALSGCSMSINRLDETAGKLDAVLKSSITNYQDAEEKSKKGEYTVSKQEFLDMIEKYPYHNHYEQNDVMDDLREDPPMHITYDPRVQAQRQTHEKIMDAIENFAAKDAAESVLEAWEIVRGGENNPGDLIYPDISATGSEGGGFR